STEPHRWPIGSPPPSTNVDYPLTNNHTAQVANNTSLAWSAQLNHTPGLLGHRRRLTWTIPSLAITALTAYRHHSSITTLK
ncbi:MAG: hypothetical protein ACKPKO_10730, partial [Candidatus Fonsibacter sp.]